MGSIGCLSVRNVCTAFAVPLLGFALAGSAGDARAGDLVAHNGFEACWSQSITEALFLAAQHDAIDNQTACVPQQNFPPFGTACDTAACPGGAVGCPVTLHANPFSGSFASGTSSFSSTGTADDITVHVTPTGGGACTITVSNITLGYGLDYTLNPDGNNGLYAASLDQTSVTITGHTTTPDSNATCILIASGDSLLIGQAESNAAQYVSDLESPATVGESVCPL